MKQDSDLKLM